MPNKGTSYETNLQVWEQEVEFKGWNKDGLYSSIEHVWGGDYSVQGKDTGKLLEGCEFTRFNDTQKALLCLSLLGRDPRTAAGKIGVTKQTCTQYCSRGLFRALNKVYFDKKKDIIKVQWNNIPTVCEKLEFLDLNNSLSIKILGYLKEGKIHSISSPDPEVIKVVKKFSPQIDTTLINNDYGE